MKQIQESPNAYHWPRQAVKTIETRKRDLVFRISDWTRNKEEPAFDVETYIGGVYDWNESETFTLSRDLPRAEAKQQAKLAAIEFVKSQVEKIL